MITLLTILHIIVSVFLILVVLLQQGKGQDFAGTFGGGGTQASFGARGSATLLHRLTTLAAVMFMVTSLSLTVMISRPGTGSVISEGAGSTATPAEVEPVSGQVPLPVDEAEDGSEATPAAASEPEADTEN